MRYKQYLAIVLALFLIAGVLCGCSAQLNEAGFDGDYGKVDTELSAPEQVGQSQTPENRKLIRTVRLEAETENMDTLLTQLDAQIAQLGGYVENRKVYNGSDLRNRYADMTIRIPVENMDGFVRQVSDCANVISSTENMEDVTLSYIATQSRITALETEQTRLLELLAQAKDMEDLLMIESRLTQVRTELEEVTSQLRLYDNLVDYGTIHLSLREVQVYTATQPQTLWQRITTGFAESMENLGTILTDLLVQGIIHLPYLIPAAVIALAVLVILKVINGGKGKKSRKNPPKEPEQT